MLGGPWAVVFWVSDAALAHSRVAGMSMSHVQLALPAVDAAAAAALCQLVLAAHPPVLRWRQEGPGFHGGAGGDGFHGVVRCCCWAPQLGC